MVAHCLAGRIVALLRIRLTQTEPSREMGGLEEVTMPDYRRNFVAGGTYFFTVNLLERQQDTLVRHIDCLRAAVQKTRHERPFHIDV
jgi:hypothetical protein